MFVAGCSDDTSSSNPPVEDASADHTTPAEDAAQSDASQHDANVADTSVTDSALADSTTADSAASDGSLTDASHDASVDAAQASDSGGDASLADASSDAADASQAADASDASDGGVCTTTIALLGGGDGGTNDAGKAPRILFSFDPSDADASDAGLDPNWANYSDSGSSGTLSETSTAGYPCPGALSLSVTYTAYGPKDQIYYNYQSGAQDWTGYTTMHVWLKVITSDYTSIQGVEPRIDSNAYGDKLFGGFVGGSTFAGGGWHESVINLTPGATYVPSTVNGFQFELQTTGAAADGGAGAPPQATLLVDSIWLE
jgi:hypothetical protein